MLKYSYCLALAVSVAACSSGGGGGGGLTGTQSAAASNASVSTTCAEHDNVNIPFAGTVQAYVIEATHPAYEVGQDECGPNFANCPPAQPGFAFTPAVIKLFDDGTTVVEAVRESEWWLPNGMQARVDDASPVSDAHYIRVYRKISEADSWPQVLVLYMDGNLRLIPQPPVGAPSVCFGSSFIIGRAETAVRPLAEIESVRYLSGAESLEIVYVGGGEALLEIAAVDRTRTRVQVTVGYPTDAPFLTFRSMYVSDGNADVDSVEWTDEDGGIHSSPIADFSQGTGTEWFFHRAVRSVHNTSAPDFRVWFQ